MRRLRPVRTLAFLASALTPGLARAAGGGEGGGVGDLLWPTFNLVLLLIVLFIVARKPLVGWFADRRDRIKDELDSAARMRAEAEERYARWQRQLADLDAEIERIRTTSRERAETERERILADAASAAERIRDDARVAVEHEVQRARKQLRDEASHLAVELAGEMLRGQLSESDQHRLVDEFIDTVEGASPAVGARLPNEPGS